LRRHAAAACRGTVGARDVFLRTRRHVEGRQMNEIEGSASYVRSSDPPEAPLDAEALQHASDVTPPDANLRIWELLETPQTVETICRVLRHEFDLPPAACTEGVRVVLTKLYREDLIEQSPDT
jgi:hypothetical protein